MSWLDLVIIGLLVANVVLSLKRGLVREVFSLAGVVSGLVIAGKFYKNITFFEGILKNQVLARTVSFILIFAGVAVALSLAGILVHKFVKLGGLGMLDHLGGFIFGFLKGVMLIGLVFFFLSKFAVVQGLVEKSPVASVILRVFRSIVYLVWAQPETTEYL